MKIIATLVLGLAGLAIVLGGLGAVAKDTFPSQVPLNVPVHTAPAAQAGDPTLLIICVVVVVIGFALGNRR